MAFQTPLLLALTLLLTLHTATACYSPCRFRFCHPAKLVLGKPDMPLSPPICLGRSRIGVVNTYENFIRPRPKANVRPLARFARRRLVTPFVPTFFKAFSMKNGFSAIGHQTPQAGQAGFLKGRCFIVEVTAYQKVRVSRSKGRKGRKGLRVIEVLDNVNFDPKKREPLRNCVSFTVA